MSAGQVWIDNISIGEGSAGTKVATFTVRRSGGADAFDVSFATADGTALVADGDYVATSGVLHFGAGVESRTISVTVKGDSKFELDEDFIMKLSGATNGATILRTQAFGIIMADEKTSGAGRVWISDSSIVEGNSGSRLMTFTVERAGGSAAFSVNYATAPNYGDAIPGTDYVPKSGVLNFAAGQTTKTITIEVKGDTIAEGMGFDGRKEYFAVSLSDATAGAVITSAFGGFVTPTGFVATAIGTILDDDVGARGIVSISGPVTVTEGNTGTKVVKFTVTRSGGTGAFSVDYSTAPAAAQAGTDFVQKTGTLQFAAGVNSQTISITINGDTNPEPDEFFSIYLRNATNGALIGVGSSSATIVNDDGTGAGYVWIDDATTTEGNDGTKLMTFTVSRSSGAQPFSINYQTEDGYGYDPYTGTSVGRAIAFQDYTPASGVLQFAAGVMSRTVTVALKGDTTAETTESFLLRLSNPTNGANIWNKDFGTGTILDDDGTIPSTAGHIRIDDVTVIEGDSGTRLATFTVTRSGGTRAFAIDYNTADYGASVVGGDYLATSGTLQFAAGVTSQTITVAVKGDTTVESDERFAVALSNATNGAIVDRSVAYGQIFNDDIAGFTGVVSIGDAAGLPYVIQEGNSGTKTMIFTVTRTLGTGAFSVNYATADGTATAADGDYVATSGTLNFASGVNSQKISVVVKGDTRPEADQSFFVRLSEPTNGALLGFASRTATILNDEPTVLVDTGAKLGAMTPAQLAALAGQGIRQIDASDDRLALKAAQWTALLGDPNSLFDDVLPTAADDVTLKDSGANIAALSSSALASLGRGVDRIDVTDNALALSMTQAINLRVPLSTGDVLTVRDTGQSIAFWPASYFTDLAARFPGSFDATDNILSLRVDQYRALGRRTLTAADTVTLVDTGANLADLSAASIAALAGKGIDRLDATDNKVSLTVAQYRALGSVKLTLADTVLLADSGDRIATLTSAEIALLGAAGIDRINATNNALVLDRSQYASLGTVGLTAADSVTLKDTGARLAGLSSTALAALSGKGVDIVDASDNALALTAGQFAALGTVAVSASNALTVTGTSGNDTFTFGMRPLAATDRVVGGGGTDTLILDGDYSAGLVLQPTTIAGVEQITVKGSHSYSLRLNDGNVAAGQTLAVNGAALGALDSLIFDGSAETNGRLSFTGGAGSSTVTGGKGADSFTGGSGKDTVRYTAAAQSTGAAYDTVAGFNAAIDRFDLWTGVTAVDTPITRGSLSSATFDANLTAAMTRLAAHHAVLFTANAGTLAGSTFLVIDTNNVAGYQSGADLAVKLQQPTNLGTLGTTSFL